MKQAKQRVIAIDYFRGACILAVLLNHGMAFSMPFAYIAGAGRLWTSFAEMFFLLSGLTYGVVRGPQINLRFKEILLKTWRRAVILYLINIVAVVLTLGLAYLLITHNLKTSGLGTLPQWGPIGTLINILTMNYGIGYSTILMYYVLFLLIAPFAAYALKTRYWLLIPILSIAIFVPQSSNPDFGGLYYWASIWQLYFILGLVLARFRLDILGWFYNLRPSKRKKLSYTVSSISLAALGVSVLLEYNLFPTVDRLTNDGWLPWKLRAVYFHLMSLKQPLDFLLANYRTGILRPLFTLLMLAGAYLLYQHYKKPLLARTGKFVNTMGQQTLWVFVAQAFTIPLLNVLPLRRGLLTNTILTAGLIYGMWLVANRREVISSVKSYSLDLKESYALAKYSYLSRYEDI